jgi:hypothetical protein
MTLEIIRRNGYPEKDRALVEETVAKSVEENADFFIAKYKEDERSFGGRYVAADLFKETFEQYSESKEARNRYNAPVHNSAAVLSGEQFRRVLADKTHPERDTVVFLTGIPGAGKTSSVLAGGDMPNNYKMIFEGQLSNQITTKEKIQQVVDAGLKPLIIAVHARPENALENTFKRFNEEGRGASINVMSNIQGGLPDSLNEVHKQFGNAVEFKVYDYRDRENPKKLTGWNNLDILKSEGNHAQIKQKLSAALEQHYAEKTITEANYRQASGAAPLDRGRSMGRSDHGEHETNVPGRRIPTGNSEKVIMKSVDTSHTDIAVTVEKERGKHLAELKNAPGFEKHSGEELAKVAFFRAVLVDKEKFSPVDQQEAAIAKYDLIMKDRQNVAKLPDLDGYQSQEAKPERAKTQDRDDLSL